MTKILFTIRIASLIALPFLYSCGTNQSQAVATETPQEYPVETVISENTTVSMDYPANLQGQQNIEIRPKVDGFI